MPRLRHDVGHVRPPRQEAIADVGRIVSPARTGRKDQISRLRVRGCDSIFGEQFLQRGSQIDLADPASVFAAATRRRRASRFTSRKRIKRLADRAALQHVRLPQV
jgi:hypothetical protein